MASEFVDTTKLGQAAESCGGSSKTCCACGAFFDDALRILLQKNADYGDSWRAAGSEGLLIRAEDKWRRIANVMRRGKMHVEESLRESLLDAANYAALLALALEEEGEEWGVGETKT